MNQYNMIFVIDRLKNILTSQKLWVLPLAIFAINFLLRIINLDSSSLWYDEVFSIFHAHASVDKILKTCEWDINPPLYLIVLHYWSTVFGFTSFSARLLSVLFVALASAILYLFCDKYLNKKTALIASALFLVSNDFFFYAHEARAYTMILFLTLSSTYLFFSLLFEPKFWKLIAVGGINFLIFYTHYLAGLFFVGQVLVSLLYDYHKGFKYYVFSYIVLIVCLYHWIPRVIQIITTKSGIGWLAPPMFPDFANFWVSALYGIVGFVLIIALLLYFIFNYNVLIILKDPRVKKDKIIIIIYLFISSIVVVLINFFLSGVMTPMFLKRYLLFTIPFFYILFSYLLSLTKVKDYIIIIGVSVICVIGLINIDWNPQKGMDYKNAVIHLQKTDSPRRAYFTDIDMLFAYYHNNDCFYDYDNLEASLGKQHVYRGDDTNKYRVIDFSKYDEIVLLQSFESSYDPESKIIDLLKRSFTFQEAISQFSGLRIHVFKNDKKIQAIGDKIDPKYLKDEKVKAVIFKMLGDSVWLDQIKTRAKEINVELDEQLFNEATWVVSQEKANLK